MYSLHQLTRLQRLFKYDIVRRLYEQTIIQNKLIKIELKIYHVGLDWTYSCIAIEWEKYFHAQTHIKVDYLSNIALSDECCINPGKLLYNTCLKSQVCLA